MYSKLRRMRWVGHVACMGRGACRIFVEKPQRKRLLGRLRSRWEDNIKIDLQEVGCGSMNWIDLAQDRDRLGGTCEYGNEPSGSIKCGEFLDWLQTG